MASTGTGLPRSRVEDALARFMSIADEFTFGLLIEVTETRLPHDPRVAVLWERYVDRETDSWEQRFASWEQLHQVSVTEFPRYSALLGFIEARNAVVHGLGFLTRKQLKKTQRSLGRLKSAQIDVVANQLSLTVDDATKCASVVADFIAWLDSSAARLLLRAT
jgi:hypothetical protein